MKRASWSFLNAILVGFKKFPLFKLMYKISWAPSVYHYTLALLGALIYRFPSKKIIIVGITGTKGKTTTVELVNAVLKESGVKTASVSSAHIKIADKSEANLFGNTQPGRFFIQYFLREAVKRGCRYVVIEVASEGILLHRHRFIDFDVAVFLGIHPEHIEAHGSFENYLDAKLSFFRYAVGFGKREKSFIVKDGDPYSARFVSVVKGGKIVKYGKYKDPLKLIGDFNRENAAAARAVARVLGVRDEITQKALANFEGVPGRMEFIQKEPFAVVVDYAHTPDSLRAVYETLRKDLETENPKSGELICVFGSDGGGRDKWKRPKLGWIAAEYCKKIILTSENPFDEDPGQILSDIKSGIQNDKISRSAKADRGSSMAKPSGQMSKVYEIIDRREAIEKAINLANDGDMVVITGKGSEPYIYIAGGKRIDWSDAGVARDAIINRK